MTEDQFRHVHLLLLVDLDGNPISVVTYADRVGFGVDDNLEGIHGGVALLVVGGVDEDLVEDLVEAGDEGDGAVDHEVGDGVEDPECLGVLFNGADVGVGAEEDVLELGLLLVHFFNGFAGGGVGRWVHVGGVAGLERASLVDRHWRRFLLREREREFLMCLGHRGGVSEEGSRERDGFEEGANGQM